MPAGERTTWLYDAVAAGMRAYVAARFDVRVLGGRRPRLDPGTIVASTHRGNDDAPLLCGTLYFAGRLWLHRDVRATFSVRDDLFERGAFAGVRDDLPLALRRALWPVSIGRTLERQLGCLPIRSATSARLFQLLREAPGLPVERLPPETAAAIAERARGLRLPQPRSAGELVCPEYADLVSHIVERDELAIDELEPVWRRRRGAALDDLRRLIDVLARGGRLLLFPEGHPSPDGAIGPLLPGLSAFVRRGRCPLIQPVAVSYDPLRRGRPRAYVAVGEPFRPVEERLGETVLAALKRTTPLTAGQLAAAAAVDGEAPAPAAVAGAVERALAERRPVDPDLLGRDRAARLEEALAAARARPEAAARLARERASAEVSAGA